MDGLCAYGLYVALKNHFTSDYDYFKYDKKIRSVEKSFDKKLKLRTFYLNIMQNQQVSVLGKPPSRIPSVRTE